MRILRYTPFCVQTAQRNEISQNDANKLLLIIIAFDIIYEMQNKNHNAHKYGNEMGEISAEQFNDPW